MNRVFSSPSMFSSIKGQGGQQWTRSSFESVRRACVEETRPPCATTGASRSFVGITTSQMAGALSPQLSPRPGADRVPAVTHTPHAIEKGLTASSTGKSVPSNLYPRLNQQLPPKASAVVTEPKHDGSGSTTGSSGCVAVFSATWTAAELMERTAGSRGAIWPYRVSLTQDSLSTLEDYGCAQVVTNCAATADMLGFCDMEVLSGARTSRRQLHRQGPGQAWQMVGVSCTDMEDLEPLELSQLPTDAKPQPLPASLAHLPPVWRWAYCGASAYVRAQVVADKPSAPPSAPLVHTPVVAWEVLEQLLASALRGTGTLKQAAGTLSTSTIKQDTGIFKQGTGIFKQGAGALKQGPKAAQAFGSRLALIQFLVSCVPQALATGMPGAAQTAHGLPCSSSPLLDAYTHAFPRGSQLVPT